MLPIRYAPITIELVLVDEVTEPIFSRFDTTATSGADLKTDSTALVWSINIVRVKLDVCTLDNSSDDSYAQRLLSGKNFPICYNIFVSQCKPLRAQTLRSSTSLACSRA